MGVLLGNLDYLRYSTFESELHRPREAAHIFNGANHSTTERFKKTCYGDWRFWGNQNINRDSSGMNLLAWIMLVIPRGGLPQSTSTFTKHWSRFCLLRLLNRVVMLLYYIHFYLKRFLRRNYFRFELCGLESGFEIRLHQFCKLNRNKNRVKWLSH